MKKINIVGGGISGCSLAFFLKDEFDVHLFEKTESLGGLSKTFKSLDNLYYQKGVHIIHTNEKWIRDLISSFVDVAEIDYYVAMNPLIDFQYYKIPFDTNTINMMPWHWKESILQDLEKINGETASNLKELVINFYGETIYTIFYENYFKSLFRKDAAKLDNPYWFRKYLRDVNVEHNYHPEEYVFASSKGYNDLFTKLTTGVNVTFNSSMTYENFSKDETVLLTCRPDLFFDKKERLGYVKSSFDIDSSFYAENKPDVMLYPNFAPFIAIHQFGKIFKNKENKNIIVKEYSKGSEETYPTLTHRNIKMMQRYKDKYRNVYFAGRFGSFEMLDMADCIHQSSTIAAKIKHSEKILHEG
jgi:UDP-galactopyranose mutase